MKNSIRFVLSVALVLMGLSILTSQGKPQSTASVTTVPGFLVKPPTSISKGLEFLVDVRLNDPDSTMNLFGLSFDFTFTNTAVVDYVSIDTTGTLFGGDILYFAMGDDKNGKASLGFSKKKPAAGINGRGSIARIKLKTTMSAAAGTMVVFAVTNVKAIDSAGAAIAFTTASDSASIAKGNIIWPGDTDSSGVVTQADLLPIGFHWLRTGTKRTSASTTWAPQPALPWTPAAAVYADANGDGTVNQADVLVIGLNWQKTATAGSWSILPLDTLVSFAKVVGGTPSLRPVVPGSVGRNGEFSVDVVVGDQSNPVSSLFGISYVLDFSSAKTALQVVDILPGTFLGSDIIFFPQTDHDGGSVSFGITRKAGQAGVTGTGVVARVTFRLLSPITGAEFRTRDIAANNQYGNAIQVSPAVSTTAVAVGEVSTLPLQYALSQNYPNPFNPSTTFSYRIASRGYVRLKILDVLGREVATLVDELRDPGSYSVRWNASHVPSGTYLCVLDAGSFHETIRTVLLK
jgi:hypothetical protein